MGYFLRSNPFSFRADDKGNAPKVLKSEEEYKKFEESLESTIQSVDVVKNGIIKVAWKPCSAKTRKNTAEALHEVIEKHITANASKNSHQKSKWKIIFKKLFKK